MIARSAWRSGRGRQQDRSTQGAGRRPARIWYAAVLPCSGILHCAAGPPQQMHVNQPLYLPSRPCNKVPVLYLREADPHACRYQPARQCPPYAQLDVNMASPQRCNSPCDRNARMLAGLGAPASGGLPPAFKRQPALPPLGLRSSLTSIAEAGAQLHASMCDTLCSRACASESVPWAAALADLDPSCGSRVVVSSRDWLKASSSSALIAWSYPACSLTVALGSCRTTVFCCKYLQSFSVLSKIVLGPTAR